MSADTMVQTMLDERDKLRECGDPDHVALLDMLETAEVARDNLIKFLAGGEDGCPQDPPCLMPAKPCVFDAAETCGSYYLSDCWRKWAER